MSKELEALDRLYCSGNLQLDYVLNNEHKQDYETIKQALQRLESIDNANPSEALENIIQAFNNTLEVSNKARLIFNEKSISIDWNEVEEIKTIKQALLKAQEMEKVLKIIKKKNVVVEWFTKKRESEKYFKLEIYNAFIPVERQLTEEEFDLLKRYFECKSE